METRRARAGRDTRAVWLTRREFAYATIAAPATFAAQYAIRRELDVTGLIVAVVAVAIAFFVIPLVVYIGSWATAVGRIHRDELIALKEEIAQLRAAVEAKADASELVGELRGLRSFADILSRRIPPWGPTPSGLDGEVDEWASKVSEALAGEPELRAQFDKAPDENVALSAIKANPLSQRVTSRTTVLDAIIKYLAGRAGASS